MPAHVNGMPIASSGMRRTVSGAAMRMSHAAASSAAPPITWPCSAATVTSGTRSNCSNSRCHVPLRWRHVDQSPSSGGYTVARRSAPALNARPAPRSTNHAHFGTVREIVECGLQVHA